MTAAASAGSDGADAGVGQVNDPYAGLDERAVAILDFERRWWKYAGGKEQAIRDDLEMSPTRYYQVLNALLDRPEALAYDVMLVKRLLRLRSSRSRVRAPAVVDMPH